MAGKIIILTVLVTMVIAARSLDTNSVFNPCSDAKVKKHDGFTFGFAFSSKESFFNNQIQLSPCDRRLALGGTDAQLAVFRPKIDELTYLTINSTDFDPVRPSSSHFTLNCQ